MLQRRRRKPLRQLLQWKKNDLSMMPDMSDVLALKAPSLIRRTWEDLLVRTLVLPYTTLSPSRSATSPLPEELETDIPSLSTPSILRSRLSTEVDVRDLALTWKIKFVDVLTLLVLALLLEEKSTIEDGQFMRSPLLESRFVMHLI